MTYGMVLGKFMPPHLGHVYLIDFARHYCDHLTVVVGSLAAEPIPGSLRYQWLQELFPTVDAVTALLPGRTGLRPTVQVVHLTDELPQEPSQHPDFWTLWQASLNRILPHAPDYVFASETYGVRLAEVLHAQFVPVDIERQVMPISGTAVRTHPIACWEYLPDVVRPYYVKRVCIFGPESTGKTTLAGQLGERFRTTVVPEYARGLLTRQAGRIGPEDMPVIARGQLAAEDALARRANRLLICDTDALTTAIWSEVLFDSCPTAIRQMAAARRYDLTLLTDVDVPWVPDPVRYLPRDRQAFLRRCIEELSTAKRPYTLLTGPWDIRFQTACWAIETLLQSPEPCSPA